MDAFNFEPMTPTAYLDRSAEVFADRTAVVDGQLRLTYAQFRDRCVRQAGALADLGVAPGDRVAVLCPNTHLLLEMHYAVPYSGAVLVALNVRLSSAELARIVAHAGCRALVYAPHLSDLAHSIAAGLDSPILLVDGADDDGAGFYAAASPLCVPVADERQLLALNYTSGTTGGPKGVMYHHRGAYLQALAMVTHFRLTSDSVYLWTLPMFHCNGWSFTWAVTAAGGQHVCLPQVEPTRIVELLVDEQVTHFCCAPTVLISIVSYLKQPVAHDRPVVVAVGGAPPTASLLSESARLGFDVTHLYGLTETFGPIIVCDWRSEWDQLSIDDQAIVRARQGVGNVISAAARVVDGDGADVPRDGAALGEIALRGNNLMLGYYRDEAATRAAVPDGWFRTGDLAVHHPDGYIQIRDRAKDVIISGGENIASIEIESALASHPAVLEAAVFAVPDDRWGERPAALVTLRPGAEASADELRAHVRLQLAGFKVPERIDFGPLPKTATGKIQKFRLREAAFREND